MKDFFKVLLILIVLYVLWRIYKSYISMNMSDRGIAFLSGLEGREVRAYQDSKGLWTIGVGHLIKSNEQHLMSATLTDKQINDLFRADLKRFVDAANEAINVPLSQHEFDAVISVLYNIGSGWADGIGTDASFVSDINFHKGKTKTLHDIMQFRKPAELLRRRAKEARLFDTGNYNWTNASISAQEVNHYATI